MMPQSCRHTTTVGARHTTRTNTTKPASYSERSIPPRSPANRSSVTSSSERIAHAVRSSEQPSEGQPMYTIRFLAPNESAPREVVAAEETATVQVVSALHLTGCNVWVTACGLDLTEGFMKAVRERQG